MGKKTVVFNKDGGTFQQDPPQPIITATQGGIIQPPRKLKKEQLETLEAQAEKQLEQTGKFIAPWYVNPKEDGSTYREDKFKEYYSVYSYFDPSMNMLSYLCDYMDLDEESRIWAALIFSATYSATTTYFFLLQFPKYTEASIEALEEWWKENRENIICQSDRRYVRSNNMFIPIIQDYREKVGENQRGHLETFVGKTKYETYNNLYKWTQKLKYYGRFSTFLFMEAIYTLTDIDMDQDWMDWKYSSTATQGMAHVIYRDDIVERSRVNRLTKEDCATLDKSFSKLVSDLRNHLPERDLAIWDIESALCGYRKLFKQTRYLTYYTDRELQEITKMSKWNKDTDFSPMYDFRKKYINKKFLGEYNGWTGTRNSLTDVFMKTGDLWTEPLPELNYVDLAHPK